MVRRFKDTTYDNFYIAVNESWSLKSLLGFYDPCGLKAPPLHSPATSSSPSDSLDDKREHNVSTIAQHDESGVTCTRKAYGSGADTRRIRI